MDEKNPTSLENNSLETPEDSPASSRIVSTDAPAQNDTGVVIPNAPREMAIGPKENIFKRIRNKVNVYFLLLIAVLAVLIGVSLYAIQQNRKADKKATLNTQKLTTDALEKLAGTDSSVGDPKQTLTVESNAIFNGGVLVKGNIDIAGGIKVGGNLSLPGLSVGGITTVEQLAAKSVTVSGDAAIQGKVTIQNGLSVSGGAAFSSGVSAPQITVDKLQLNGDLQLSRHITSSGGIPGHTNGSALGSGGSSSNSGNDVSGTATINTGGSAPAGCFMTINFTSNYGSTPRVILSPASSSAASLSYYTNRSNSGFSICTTSDPPDGTSGIIFDYIVIG